MAKGLTQKSLAEKSGISLSYMSEIENGYFDVRITKLYHISLGLGVKHGKMLDY
jgi:transcriptional regulator with XRE-family HTH domain